MIHDRSWTEDRGDLPLDGPVLPSVAGLLTDPRAEMADWRRRLDERAGWWERFERARRELEAYSDEELRQDLGIFPTEIDRVAAQTASMRS